MARSKGDDIATADAQISRTIREAGCITSLIGEIYSFEFAIEI
jgi:hypothetical protein